MIPFPPFEPDRTRYAVGASTRAINCLPVRDGWGPKPDIVAISEALAAPCLGAIYVRTSLGAYDLIAGTATGLYKLAVGTYIWEDISGSDGPFDVPSGDRWSFTKFGQRLFATNIVDGLFVYDIDAAGDFALVADAPRAKYVWSAGDFLVLGYIQDQANRVQWSGIGDASYWEVGLRGSDFQDLFDGEEVMGGISSEGGALIFQRRKIRQMVITDSIDFAFRFGEVNPDRGVIAPYSIAAIGPGQFAYLSEDGFFAGVDGRPIGAERVDRWFQENCNLDLAAEIRGVADPYRKIVWWQCPAINGTQFLLGWNWQLDRWCYAENNVTEMAVMVSPAPSWDELDDIYATIDDVDVPFDARIFQGGRPEFAAFTTDNKLGFFSGAAMAATMETGEVELNPGVRSFLQEATVYTNADSYTLTVGTANKHGEAIVWGSAVTPYTQTGICHFRSSGKLHRFRLSIPAGEVWDHAIGLDARSRREGRR